MDFIYLGIVIISIAALISYILFRDSSLHRCWKECKRKKKATELVDLINYGLSEPPFASRYDGERWDRWFREVLNRLYELEKWRTDCENLGKQTINDLGSQRLRDIKDPN